MNTQTQEALKMAGYDLDGVIADVEKFDGFDDVCLQTIKRVRSTIAEALEQPTVAELNDEYLRDTNVTGLEQPAQYSSLNEFIAEMEKDPEFKELMQQEKAKLLAYFQALEQAKQEPVAWMDENNYVFEKESDIDSSGIKIPLYTHPHQWQGLTDDEILKASSYIDMLGNIDDDDVIKFARAIEQELKEKNGN